MPEKHLRANGNEGSGTQSKKKIALPVANNPDENEQGKFDCLIYLATVDPFTLCI
jgi:hypothetical protein